MSKPVEISESEIERRQQAAKEVEDIIRQAKVTYAILAAGKEFRTISHFRELGFALIDCGEYGYFYDSGFGTLKKGKIVPSENTQSQTRFLKQETFTLSRGKFFIYANFTTGKITQAPQD